MLLDKAQLAVAAQVAKEPGRWSIDKVAVEPDGTCVATSGKDMVIVPPCAQKDGDWPTGSGGTPVTPSKRALFPAHVFTDALKALGRKPLPRPVLNNAAITAVGEYVELTTTDLNKTRKFGANAEDDSHFPDWQAMVPDPSRDETVVAFDITRLRELLTTLSKMTQDAAVICRIPHNNEAAVLEVQAQGRTVTALVAPVRVAR